MFLAIAVHHVVPEHKEAMKAFMTTVTETVTGTAGLIEFGGYEDQGGKLVGISRWESPEAFQAALPVIMSMSDQRRPEWTSAPDDLLAATPF